MNDVRYYTTPRLDNLNAPVIKVIEQTTYEPNANFMQAEGGIGRWHLIGHSVGFAGGIYYSFQKKTGFWKGLGITLVVAIAGGALGMAVDALVNNNKDKK